MKHKLRDSQGETLVEVLASILISSLSIALLFSAVMASSRMDQTARTLDDQYYEDLSKTEAQSGRYTPPSAATVELSVKNDATGGEAKPSIIFYGTERLLSYAADAAASPAPGPGGGP